MHFIQIGSLFRRRYISLRILLRNDIEIENNWTHQVNKKRNVKHFPNLNYNTVSAVVADAYDIDDNFVHLSLN